MTYLGRLFLVSFYPRQSNLQQVWNFRWAIQVVFFLFRPVDSLLGICLLWLWEWWNLYATILYIKKSTGNELFKKYVSLRHLKLTFAFLIKTFLRFSSLSYTVLVFVVWFVAGLKEKELVLWSFFFFGRNLFILLQRDANISPIVVSLFPVTDLLRHSEINLVVRGCYH